MTHFTPLIRLSIVSAICLLIFGVVASGLLSRASAQQRKFEVSTYKDMPVTVQEVRNLQSDEDKWFRDLQIVVKNISNKPVYFISMSVQFPDIAPPSETSRIGFNLHFGRPELGDTSVAAGPDDVPIQPGDTHVFTIPDYRVKGFESLKKRRGIELTKRLRFGFESISFGDQTGFPNAGVSGFLDFRGKAEKKAIW